MAIAQGYIGVWNGISGSLTTEPQRRRGKSAKRNEEDSLAEGTETLVASWKLS
jgi:hypothetical protein